MKFDLSPPESPNLLPPDEHTTTINRVMTTIQKAHVDLGGSSFPEPFNTLMFSISGVKLDLFSIMPLECFSSTDFFLKLVAATTVPIGVSFLVLGYRIVRVKLSGYRMWSGNVIFAWLFSTDLMVYRLLFIWVSVSASVCVCVHAHTRAQRLRAQHKYVISTTMKRTAPRHICDHLLRLSVHDVLQISRRRWWTFCFNCRFSCSVQLGEVPVHHYFCFVCDGYFSGALARSPRQLIIHKCPQLLPN